MTARRFRVLARYNAWANRRLYDAVGRLPEEEFARPRRAFFGSICGTLNHILVGDRLWRARIEGHDAGISALDQILHPDLEGLRRAREDEDARLIALADSLDAEALERELAYVSMEGEKGRVPVRWVLTHVFNHQTHHRGQVHDMLSQTDVAPPPLDLIYFIREGGLG